MMAFTHCGGDWPPGIAESLRRLQPRTRLERLMAKHPNRIKSTNKVMKQARSIKRSGHKVKQGKGKK